MFEQQEQSTDVVADSKKDSKLSYNDAKFQKLVIKYALLKEQNFQCLYTGKTINIANLFNDNYGALLDERAQKKLCYLYHPSSISIYQPAKLQKVEVGEHILSKRLLGSPDVGVFKNPVAMRALHILRKHINELIINGVIDEDYTRVVVELARDMNDANMRKAIEIYQNKTLN